MESAVKTKKCSNCRKSYVPEEGKMVCPHCGKPRWGEVVPMYLMSLVMTGVFVWLFFFVAPNVESTFWRIILKVGSAFLGICFVIGDIALPFGIREEQRNAKSTKSHSAGVSDAVLTRLSDAVVNGTMTMDEAEDVIQQLVHTAPAGEAPHVPENRSPLVEEIDESAIISANRSGNDEQMAKLLFLLDRQSDREYSADQAVSSRTNSLIKYIGDILNRNGGEDRMRAVLMRAGQMGCNTRFIEREWNGIGTWWG